MHPIGEKVNMAVPNMLYGVIQCGFRDHGGDKSDIRS